VQEFIATLNSNFRTWIQSLLEAKPWRRVEVLIAFALLLIAIFTRFYDLETRVMSHDESEHTYFAWFYAENGSYQHTLTISSRGSRRPCHWNVVFLPALVKKFWSANRHGDYARFPVLSLL
jgi:hypothetical protein